MGVFNEFFVIELKCSLLLHFVNSIYVFFNLKS